MSENERTRQSRRKVALALQKAKEARVLREVSDIGRLVDGAVKARSNPPPPESDGVVVQVRKP